MEDLKTISHWKSSLGLLPIHLNPEIPHNYILLNGGYGDFCLQTENGGESLSNYYSKSWSSNTKNFLVLENDNIRIHNWLLKKEEVVSFELVKNNIEKFYKYLLSKSYDSSKDIVPHLIDIFRQFRNLTFEKSNPTEALNLLFLLLASIEDDIDQVDGRKWNFEKPEIPDGFNFYIEKLKSGIGNIQPDLNLILRHSAGVLFQEAQKEVLFFNPQQDLFGGHSNELKTKKNLYSSIHYTPPYLSRSIVENTLRHIDLNQPKLKIFDPACGSCEFLIEVLKQLKELQYNGTVEIIGWDNSPTAVTTSNFLLKFEQRNAWGRKLDFQVRLVDDSLQERWDEDYDIILMNPPFISWELLNNRDNRDSVKAALEGNFKGRPNQASAFFYKAIKNLKATGTIGCVIPTSILNLDSYKKLREEIYDILNIKLIGKLGNFIFEDALTDVSFLIGQKPEKLDYPTVLWTRNEKGIAQNALRDLRKLFNSNDLTRETNDYSIYQPISFPILKESWQPISLKNNNLLKNMERFVLDGRLVRIEEIFTVKQGIRTGNNEAFKINKAEYDELPEKEKKFFRPATDNETIKQGVLNIRSYVWYPYDKSGILLKTEDQFEQAAPIFYNKLARHKDSLVNRARKDVHSWWYLSEHRAWLRDQKPKLISSEFGSSNSFAFDKKGVFVVERGNGWMPKKKFTEDDYYFYLALFSSVFFGKLLSIYSKQLAGGKWYDLGKKYTKDIPIPDTSNSEIFRSDIYLKLAKIGRELSEGNYYAKSILDENLTQFFYPIS